MTNAREPHQTNTPETERTDLPTPEMADGPEPAVSVARQSDHPRHDSPSDGAGDVTADPADDARGPLPGVSPERQEQFETLATEFREEGRYPGREVEVAARIVNKQRRQTGETAAQRKQAAAGRAPDRGLPIPAYDSLSVAAVLEYARELSPEEVARVVAYEKRHRRRKTLLARLTRARAAAAAAR